MITKLFCATVVLLALTNLASLPISASQVKPTVKIYLKCTVSGPTEFRTVTVENTTSSTIPSGKTIHWWLNAATQGSITLQSALAPGGKVSRGTQPHGTDPFTPKAWYFK
jgi:hypothetical protein